MAKRPQLRAVTNPPEEDERISPPPPGDNAKPLTREQKARLRLRHIANMRPVIAELDEAKALAKAIQKRLTVLRETYRGDGFSLAALDEKLKEEAKPRRENLAYEAERFELREDTGAAVYQQPDLFERMPQAARDESYWSDDGYQAGAAGKQGKPPKECPPEFTQIWLKRWGAAQERLAWALSDKGINPDRSRTDLPVHAVPLTDEEDDDDENEQVAPVVAIDPLLQ